MPGLIVLVTGGTGYVGSHSVAALARSGHRIRMLVRSPGKVVAALGPLGVDGVETVTGDVTEPAAVERALEGCEAVLHAASVFSMDPRKADEMRSVNVRGTDIVLGTAHRLGLDPIVHVSSELALLPPADGEVLTPESAVKQPPWPYSRSKADSELVARKYQALGAPVVSIMPAGLWGPQDPYLGEGVSLATNVLKNRFPVVPPGRMHVADVRDLAAVHAEVMEPGRGPRSYLVAGHDVTMPDLIRTLADLCGRRIPFVTFPRWFLAGFGRVADAVQHRMRRLEDTEGARLRAPPAARDLRRHGPMAGRGGAPHCARSGPAGVIVPRRRLRPRIRRPGLRAGRQPRHKDRRQKRRAAGP